MAEEEKAPTRTSTFTSFENLFDIVLWAQTCMKNMLIHEEATKSFHKEKHVVISDLNFQVDL